MKRAVIVHCWEGHSNYCWYPRTKTQLEAKGFKVTVPSFPHSDTPTQKDWIPYLQKEIGTPSEELLLIGHSIGCITILRYLETLSEHERVGGVILVAGFTDSLGYDELKNFFETPIDFQTIKTKSKNGFVAIHSDNDPYVPLSFGDVFKENLGAEVILKHNAGHFSGPVDNEASCLEIPEVIKSAQKLLG